METNLGTYPQADPRYAKWRGRSCSTVQRKEKRKKNNKLKNGGIVYDF